MTSRIALLAATAVLLTPAAAFADEAAEPGAGAGGDDLGEFSDDEEVEADDVPFLEEDEDDFDDSEIDGLPGEGDDD